ncbi:MAG: DUF115 domain-containing protein [Spirochaetes bacterium]|nr:DUF115 domain-containing protein [Spirochaetota bacterium]
MTDLIPRLEPRPGGTNIFYKGKFLYHEQSPEEHTRTRAISVSLPEKAIILVPSPLVGYGMKELLQRLPSSSHLVCIEKDQFLMEITLRYMVPQIQQDPRVSFIRTDSIPALIEYLGKKIDWKRFRKILLVPLNRGYILYRSFYDEVEKQLFLYLERILRNRLTTIRLGNRWMSNLFQNLVYLPNATPVTELRIQKAPLVLGAGESLEDRFEWIKKVRDAVYLISVDTALPFLSSVGIRPDLVVSVDAQAINLQDFLALPFQGIPLVADLTVFPGILRIWKGPIYLFLSQFEPLRWFEDPQNAAVLPPMLPPLGSVGNIALYIACTCSFPSLPVLCLGMDFHYVPGKPHARGTYTHRFYLSQQHRLNPSPLLENGLNRQRGTERLVNGQKVKTDPVLQSFLEVARDICQQEKRVYTLCSRGLDFGAYPVGDFPILSSIFEKIQPISSSPSQSNLPLWNTQRVLEFVQGVYETLQEIEEGVEKAISSNASPVALDTDTHQKLEALDFLFLNLPELPSSDTLDVATAIQVRSNIKRYRNLLSRVKQLFSPPTS